MEGYNIRKLILKCESFIHENISISILSTANVLLKQLQLKVFQQYEHFWTVDDKQFDIRINFPKQNQMILRITPTSEQINNKMCQIICEQDEFQLFIKVFLDVIDLEQGSKRAQKQDEIVSIAKYTYNLLKDKILNELQCNNYFKPSTGFSKYGIKTGERKNKKKHATTIFNRNSLRKNKNSKEKSTPELETTKINKSKLEIPTNVSKIACKLKRINTINIKCPNYSSISSSDKLQDSLKNISTFQKLKSSGTQINIPPVSKQKQVSFFCAKIEQYYDETNKLLTQFNTKKVKSPFMKCLEQQTVQRLATQEKTLDYLRSFISSSMKNQLSKLNNQKSEPRKDTKVTESPYKSRIKFMVKKGIR